MKNKKIKAEKKKNNGVSNKLIGISIALSVLCIALALVDMLSCLKKNLVVYSENQERYINEVLSDCSDDSETTKEVVDNIVRKIQKEYNTTASNFAFVAVGEKITFLQDETVTDTMTEYNINRFLNTNSASALDESLWDTMVTTLPNGNTVLVSKNTVTVGEEEITFGICTRQKYAIQRSNFDVLIQHLLLYMVLYSISFITTVVYLVYKEKESLVIKRQLEEKVVENRLLIEKLENKIEQSAAKGQEVHYGFTNKKTIIDIMDSLEGDRRLATQKIYISTLDMSVENVVRYAVVLDRMKLPKTVMCLWEEDKYLALMLNADKDEAKNYARQFILQYQSIYGEDIEETKITIEGL